MIAAIGVLALAVAVPWGAGWIAGQRFLSGLEHLAGSAMLDLSLVSYQRGWLSSTAVHRLESPGTAHETLEIHHRIEHFPFSGAGLARISSAPQWPYATQTTIAYYFGASPPVSAQTLVGMDGSLAMTLHSPAFGKPLLQDPAIKLTWGGARGSLRYAPSGATRVELQVPGLAMQGQGVVATFADLRLEGDSGAVSDAGWTGQALLKVSAIGLSSPQGGARLRHLETVLQRHDQGDMVRLGYRLNIGEGTALGADGERDDSFRDGVLEVELDRIDRQALQRYLQRVAHGPPEARAQLALAFLGELLQGAPELRIERVGLHTSQGTLSASGIAGLTGAQPDGGAVVDLLSRMRLDGDIDVSAALLEGWLSRDTYRGVTAALYARNAEVDEALAHALTRRFVRERIAAWSASGMLAAERDRYRMRVNLMHGHLSINGVPRDDLLPLPAPTSPERPAAAAWR
ncbi:MAG: DUF945 family protein [Burkholderiales bacterium]|nr:DUF945 family protein [Burkholderiales bacterium]